jgi:hypothetical protein
VLVHPVRRVVAVLASVPARVDDIGSRVGRPGHETWSVVTRTPPRLATHGAREVPLDAP